MKGKALCWALEKDRARSGSSSVSSLFYLDGSVAMKNRSVAEENRSVTVNFRSVAEENRSVAVDYRSVAEENRSVAVNYRSVAEENRSVAAKKQIRYGFLPVFSGAGST